MLLSDVLGSESDEGSSCCDWQGEHSVDLHWKIVSASMTILLVVSPGPKKTLYDELCRVVKHEISPPVSVREPLIAVPDLSLDNALRLLLALGL